MTLDEMEETAREWMFYSSHFGIVAEIVNGRWPSERITDFARVVLAIAPVVRAAKAERDGHIYTCACDICEAVETMTEMMRPR